MIQTGHWGDPPIPSTGRAKKHGKAKKRAGRKRFLHGQEEEKERRGRGMIQTAIGAIPLSRRRDGLEMETTKPGQTLRVTLSPGLVGHVRRAQPAYLRGPSDPPNRR